MRPDSYNNDLELASFIPSRYTWAGEQRKGTICHITDSKDPVGHTKKAMGLEFAIEKEAPLPSEVKASLEFIQNVTYEEATEFWTAQLSKVRGIVAAAATQMKWEAASPCAATRRPRSVRAVALLHLMKCFGLGGDRWMRQFVFGFPIIGEIEQTGVFPRDAAKRPPPPIGEIWSGNSTRFQTRARASGALNASVLWTEAMAQVDKGWLGPPLPIDQTGNVANWTKGKTVIAFRFGVDQMDKLRSCDDLKYSTTNMYCTVWTPIKLPTWDHIGQMTLEVANSNRPWSFMKMDHEAAYKQLPIDSDQTKYAMVALRHPTTLEWHAFPPFSLLFGAEAAVIHYNCYSRTVAILINRILGIPLIAYYDDLGALIPSDLGQLTLATAKVFVTTIGYFISGKKD